MIIYTSLLCVSFCKFMNHSPKKSCFTSILAFKGPSKLSLTIWCIYFILLVQMKSHAKNHVDRILLLEFWSDQLYIIIKKKAACYVFCKQFFNFFYFSYVFWFINYRTTKQFSKPKQNEPILKRVKTCTLPPIFILFENRAVWYPHPVVSLLGYSITVFFWGTKIIRFWSEYINLAQEENVVIIIRLTWLRRKLYYVNKHTNQYIRFANLLLPMIK